MSSASSSSSPVSASASGFSDDVTPPDSPSEEVAEEHQEPDEPEPEAEAEAEDKEASASSKKGSQGHARGKKKEKKKEEDKSTGKSKSKSEKQPKGKKKEKGKGVAKKGGKAAASKLSKKEIKALGALSVTLVRMANLPSADSRVQMHFALVDASREDLKVKLAYGTKRRVAGPGAGARHVAWTEDGVDLEPAVGVNFAKWEKISKKDSALQIDVQDRMTTIARGIVPLSALREAFETAAEEEEDQQQLSAAAARVWIRLDPAAGTEGAAEELFLEDGDGAKHVSAGSRHGSIIRDEDTGEAALSGGCLYLLADVAVRVALTSVQSKCSYDSPIIPDLPEELVEDDDLQFFGPAQLKELGKARRTSKRMSGRFGSTELSGASSPVGSLSPKALLKSDLKKGDRACWIRKRGDDVIGGWKNRYMQLYLGTGEDQDEFNPAGELRYFKSSGKDGNGQGAIPLKLITDVTRKGASKVDIFTETTGRTYKLDVAGLTSKQKAENERLGDDCLTASGADGFVEELRKLCPGLQQQKNKKKKLSSNTKKSSSSSSSLGKKPSQKDVAKRKARTSGSGKGASSSSSSGDGDGWGKLRETERERTKDQGEEVAMSPLEGADWAWVGVDGVGHKSGGPGYCQVHVGMGEGDKKPKSRRFMTDDGDENWWIIKQKDGGASLRLRVTTLNGWGGNGEVSLAYQQKEGDGVGSMTKSAAKKPKDIPVVGVESKGKRKEESAESKSDDSAEEEEEEKEVVEVTAKKTSSASSSDDGSDHSSRRSSSSSSSGP